LWYAETVGQCYCQGRPPPPNSGGSNGAPGRGGGVRDSDDRRQGRDVQCSGGHRTPGTQEASDTTPWTHSTQSGTSRGAVAQLGMANQADTTAPVPAPAPATLVPAIPFIPVPTPVRVGFAANLANNPYAALTSPYPMCDPITVSSSVPAETLDSDFIYVFAASQGIVTPSET
jgi:hypothetical protein